MKINAKKVEELMKEKNIQPVDICKHTHLPRGKLKRIIYGQQLPNRMTALLIAEALGVELQDILEDEEGKVDH